MTGPRQRDRLFASPDDAWRCRDRQGRRLLLARARRGDLAAARLLFRLYHKLRLPLLEARHGWGPALDALAGRSGGAERPLGSP